MSQYSERFSRLQEQAADSFVLRGDNILVEILPKEEIKAAAGSRIIIATDNKQLRFGTEENRGLVARVLLVGEGYYDASTESNVPLDVTVGDIVLLPKYSVSVYSVFPGLDGITEEKIGMITEGDVRMIYKDFDRVSQALNELSDNSSSSQ